MYEQYIVQGIMSGALIIEEQTMSLELDARRAAKSMLDRADFEGDSVRIITRDNELVWDGKKEGRA